MDTYQFEDFMAFKHAEECRKWNKGFPPMAYKSWRDGGGSNISYAKMIIKRLARAVWDLC
jgi:hypothetical protein